MKKTHWILLACADSLFIVLFCNHMNLIWFLSTSYLLPILLNVVCLTVFLLQRKKIFALVITLIALFFFFLMPILTFFLFTGTQEYDHIRSPKRTEEVYIGHRHATLGETTYLYTFYQVKYGLFVQELKNQPLTIMTRNYDGSDVEALGLNEVKWKNEKTMIFPTENGEKTLKLP